MKTPPFHNPNEKEDRARLAAAVVLSLLILLAFNFFVERPQLEEARRQAELAPKPAAVAVAEAETETIIARPEALKTSGRVPVKGVKVTGSLSLKGARLDDLLLNDHYQTVERLDHVELLSPSGSEKPFYA